MRNVLHVDYSIYLISFHLTIGEYQVQSVAYFNNMD